MSLDKYYVIAYAAGRESERHILVLRPNPTVGPSKRAARGISPLYGHVQLSSVPDKVVLTARCARNGRLLELSSQIVDWPQLEADAVAQPVYPINPVDAGVVLLPHDWLLLSTGQSALVRIAAIAHDRDIPGARLRIGFEGSPPIELRVSLARGQKWQQTLKIPLLQTANHCVLKLSLWDGGLELWTKTIQTVVAASTSERPRFGVVEAKLRYHAAILRYDPNTGNQLSPIDYDSAWNPALNDIIVFLPNGSRFVFWRGTNYAPFWANRFNTGVNYQWGEDLNHPIHHPNHANTFDPDFPEVMFDSALKYSRAQVIESTSSRIHVRWTYQPTTIYGDVFGETMVEDFFFYPDEFATRAATIASPIESDQNLFQLSEFLILGPQSAFPLDILPERILEVLSMDGRKIDVSFPLISESSSIGDIAMTPAIYKIFPHKEDRESAIQFSPRQTAGAWVSRPVFDQGEIVAPVYWGGYWPLVRGKPTSLGIDSRLFSNPSFSSVAGFSLDSPFVVSEGHSIDTLGQSREMLTRRWLWLIAKTDASDETLIQWAHSFSSPPSLQVTGARIDFPSYSPERRAIRLVAESRSIGIKLKPSVRTMNPVFEIDQAPAEVASVALDGKLLRSDAYAWDGGTLWIKANIDRTGAELRVQFH